MLKGHTTFMSYTGLVPFENLSHKKSLPGVLVEKTVRPIQINEKSTPYKSFMLKAQTASATGHFSNQLGFCGAVSP